MISLLDGRTIEGIDADTMIKSIVLVCMFNLHLIMLAKCETSTKLNI